MWTLEKKKKVEFWRWYLHLGVENLQFLGEYLHKKLHYSYSSPFADIMITAGNIKNLYTDLVGVSEEGGRFSNVTKMRVWKEY